MLFFVFFFISRYVIFNHIINPRNVQTRSFFMDFLRKTKICLCSLCNNNYSILLYIDKVIEIINILQTCKRRIFVNFYFILNNYFVSKIILENYNIENSIRNNLDFKNLIQFEYTCWKYVVPSVESYFFASELTFTCSVSRYISLCGNFHVIIQPFATSPHCERVGCNITVYCCDDDIISPERRPVGSFPAI